MDFFFNSEIYHFYQILRRSVVNIKETDKAVKSRHQQSWTNSLCQSEGIQFRRPMRFFRCYAGSATSSKEATSSVGTETSLTKGAKIGFIYILIRRKPYKNLDELYLKSL